MSQIKKCFRGIHFQQINIFTNCIFIFSVFIRLSHEPRCCGVQALSHQERSAAFTPQLLSFLLTLRMGLFREGWLVRAPSHRCWVEVRERGVFITLDHLHPQTPSEPLWCPLVSSSSHCNSPPLPASQQLLRGQPGRRRPLCCWAGLGVSILLR